MVSGIWIPGRPCGWRHRKPQHPPCHHESFRFFGHLGAAGRRYRAVLAFTKIKLKRKLPQFLPKFRLSSWHVDVTSLEERR